MADYLDGENRRIKPVAAINFTSAGVAAPAGSTADPMAVQGTVASGATDSGNPVKQGFKGLTGAPSAVTNGQRVDAASDEYGHQLVAIGKTPGSGGSDAQNLVAVYEGNAAGSAPVKPLGVAQYQINGTSGTWDRVRNNHEATLLASAARTTTQTGSDQTNFNAKSAYVVIDVTAGATAPGLTPAIQMKDTLSGKYIQVHANLTKITATGTYVYFFGLGAPAAAGGVTATSGFPLPRVWRLVVTVDDTTSYTYSASVHYIN